MGNLLYWQVTWKMRYECLYLLSPFSPIRSHMHFNGFWKSESIIQTLIIKTWIDCINGQNNKNHIPPVDSRCVCADHDSRRLNCVFVQCHSLKAVFINNCWCQYLFERHFIKMISSSSSVCVSINWESVPWQQSIVNSCGRKPLWRKLHHTKYTELFTKYLLNCWQFSKLKQVCFHRG